MKVLVLLLSVFLLFQACLSQTTYYVNSVNGSAENGCGSSGAPCIGLNFLPPLTDFTTIYFAPGTYDIFNNFPYTITNANITFVGTLGVVFDCNTNGTRNCLEVVTVSGYSSVSFSNIQFTGFNLDELSKLPMISITSSQVINSYHALLQTNTSTVLIYGCNFTGNLNLMKGIPGTHHHQHLISISGAYVTLENNYFTNNSVSAISATYSNLEISGSFEYQTNVPHIIFSRESLLTFDGTFDHNGNGDDGALIILSGVACKFVFDGQYIMQECMQNIIANAQVTNNNVTALIGLLDGASINMGNALVQSNDCYFFISSLYSPLATQVVLNNVTIENNSLCFIDTIFAPGSTFTRVSVFGGNEGTDNHFLNVAPGSSLYLDNFSFTSPFAPFSIVESSFIMNNSFVNSTSNVVSSIGGGDFPTTAVFQNSNFSVEGSLFSVNGLTSVYFSGCNSDSADVTSPPLQCLNSSVPASVYFFGAVNNGLSSSASLCSTYCDSANAPLCPPSTSGGADDDSGAGTTDDSNLSIYLGVLAGIFIFTTIIAFALLGYVIYYYNRKLKGLTYGVIDD